MGILSLLEKGPWLALEKLSLLWERQTYALEKASRFLCFGKGNVAVQLYVAAMPLKQGQCTIL